jgi:hypothetical protein
MADELSPMERDVLAAILAPDHPVMNALRRQLDHCRVASRETTGVGFYTHLDIDPAFEPAPVKPGRITLGDVTAEMEGLQRGAGFVLFVEDGVLDLLEGLSYDEPWLNVSGKYEVTAGGISHFAGSETDIETVDAAWVRQGDIAEH